MRSFNPGESFQNIIKQAVPNFVETDYPLFMEFIQAYLRFMEAPRQFGSQTVYPEFGSVANSAIQVTTQLGGPLYEARKMLDYRDVTTTIDDFKSHFLAMFAKSFPNYTYVPLDYLIRALRQFYQGKGTVESIEWFFRVIFNEDAEVFFPREDILKASDGTWDAPIVLKVSSPTNDHVNSDVQKFYVGQRVQTATGEAQVETVITYVVGQADNKHIVVNELRLKFDSILGFFLPGQDLFNTDSTTVVHTTIFPVITGVIVEAGGSNYAVGDIVNFSEGPAGGYGYGAFGVVASTSNTAIDGVIVADGGDGFITGLPVLFVSTSGHGASAVVQEVIQGYFELEDSTGFFLNEDIVTGETNFWQEEDINMLVLELEIDPFVNATSNVHLLDPDYGTELGIPTMVGVSFDSELELALAAVDKKPYMHPWVFTDLAHTTAELANAACGMRVIGPTFFDSGVEVFRIDNLADSQTNVGTSNLTANVIVSDLSLGGGSDTLYLKDFTGFDMLSTNVVFKQAGNGVLQLGNVALDGTANVFGTNTSFTTTCTPNTHIRLTTGQHMVVRSVVNNTFLVVTTATGVTNAAATWSVVPTGSVANIVLQAQRFYGEIKTIKMLTNGVGYEHPPVPFVDNPSSRAQEIYHLNPDPIFPVDPESANNEVVVTTEHVDVFRDAELIPQQDAGQIQTVQIINSGVNYLDANAIIVTAVHGSPRTGSNAELIAVTGALTHEAGQFTTTRGFLSADKFLQDENYYNDYTYVVRVAESFDRYRDLLLKLIHPAGFKPLGQFVDILEGPITLSVGEMETLSRRPLPVDLLISDPLWGDGPTLPAAISGLITLYDGETDI